MPISWDFGIGSTIGSIAGTIGNIVNTKQVNENNLRIARETNEANRQMVEMQNKAAREEAEKAYQRSSAPNQVELMRSAGMSRAGAINALNGGGSYTPAPVNVSQDSAPTMQTTDFTNLAQIGAAIRSQSTKDKVLKSIFDKISNKYEWYHSDYDVLPTLDELYYVLNDKQRKALTDPAIREQVNDFLNQSHKGREDNTNVQGRIFDLADKEHRSYLLKFEADLAKILRQQRISAAEQEEIAREAKARLEALQADYTSEALEKMDKDSRAKYFETRATLEWLSHAGEMTAEKFINKARTLLGL